MDFMPRLDYQTNIEDMVQNAGNTPPQDLYPGTLSSFPSMEDNLKKMTFSEPSITDTDLNNKVGEYYRILSEISTGTQLPNAMDRLSELSEEIKQYVLTAYDYNMLVDSIRNTQRYVLRAINEDVNTKVASFAFEMRKFTDAVDDFMYELEQVYSKSPSEYPIPDNGIVKSKLDSGVVSTLNYVDSTNGIIVSDTQPVLTEGKSVIWFNTGEKL